MTAQESTFVSGVSGLDEVLGGGLTANSLTLIMGAPGAGKTVLGNQIAFSAAKRGLGVLICTSTSEGHVKLLEHMENFSFFDESLIGGKITLLTIQHLIDAEPSAASSLMRTIRESGAQLLLIDGFQGVSPNLPNSQHARQVLASLATALPYLNARVLVTLAGDPRNPSYFAETTTADTVISLDYRLLNGRHERQMEVVKQRGRRQLPGQHFYRIGPGGVHIIPRLETHPQSVSRPRPSGRAPFGLPELDKLLGGGPNAGTATILAGSPGTGKTTLALHWAVQSAQPDSSTFFLTFGEFPEQLREKARAFNIALDAAEANHAVQLVRVSPTNMSPDTVGELLLQVMAGTSARRLVVDNIILLLDALGSRAKEFFSALSEHLYDEGISSLFLLEAEPFTGFRINLANSAAGQIGENLVVLQQQEATGKLRRILAVLRMRFSDYDRTVRELVLDGSGVRVLSPAETDSGALSAIASASGVVAPDDPPGT